MLQIELQHRKNEHKCIVIQLLFGMTVNVIETTNFRLQIIKFHTSNATKRAEFKRIIRPVARVTRMQLYIKLIAVHVKRRCFYLYQSNRNLRACQLHVYVYIGQKPRIHQKYTRILSVNQSSVKRQIELLRRKLTDERCNVKLVQMVVRCLASKSRGGHEDDRYKNDNLLLTLWRFRCHTGMWLLCTCTLLKVADADALASVYVSTQGLSNERIASP